MGTQQKNYHPNGFTIVEVLIVVIVVGILASFVTIGVADSQAKARDTARVTDIDTLHSKLEEYYSDNGGYPVTFDAATFPGLDPEALKDASGNSVSIVVPAADQTAAMAVSNPEAGQPNYKYIPYPTGCNAITCTGYVLKSYIERPNPTTPNPYVKRGLHNN